MMLSLLLVIALGEPLPRCDLVEINHYKPQGKLCFTQVIAWDWDPERYRWNAQQWAIVHTWRRTKDITTIKSNDGTIKIRSKLFRETMTEHDPERDNQELFPAKYRRTVW